MVYMMRGIDSSKFEKNKLIKKKISSLHIS